MNKIIKDWITALRSGEYEQGKCRLRADDRYCCLGVLCEVKNIPYNGVSYDGHGVYLPEPVAEELKMPQTGFQILESDTDDEDLVGRTLAAANDRGTSFNTIADIIEKHYETIDNR